MSRIKYNSVASLSAICSKLIDAGHLQEALSLIHDFVERIITEPLCTSQVFGSKTLDELCMHIGRISLARMTKDTSSDRHDHLREPAFVYIVTKLQKSGGHTRVIVDLIKARPEGLHIVLSTESEGKSDSDYLDSVFGKQARVMFERAPRRNHQERLYWLQKRLMGISPKTVYLFNHHQDSVAAAAIQPEMGFDACFYHHGDHHLCLGVYLSHLKHIDLHPMGYYKCRHELGIDNIYVPLTVEDKGARPADASFMNGGILTTCTAARSNKIEVPYFVSYLDVVPKLLKTTGGRHIHIGNLTPWALFRIRRGLKRSQVRSDRFIYIPWVPSVWKALHDYQVDLYIASFPYGGGLTLLEAMGAGTPVALHRHIFSRILSGIELAYPSAFSWRYPEELLHFCVSLTPEVLEEAGRLARTHYERYYSQADFPGVLDHLPYHETQCPDKNEDFAIETDEWAFWMEQQVSVKKLLSRTAIRSLLRFMARWL